jgi:predicted site-specific integrase-resolvase
MIAPSTLITLSEGGQRLELSEKTLRRYVAAGLLTGYRVGPRALRLDAAEVASLARPIPTAAGE